MGYCNYCDDEDDSGHHFCDSCGAHLVELSPYECDEHRRRHAVAAQPRLRSRRMRT
jgi:hypothetical protein